MTKDSIYFIALSLLSHVNPFEKIKLLQLAGHAEFLFQKEFLETIPQLRQDIISELTNGALLNKADEIMEVSYRHHIQICSIDGPLYSNKLRECPDAPLVLYYKGNISLNDSKIVSIVGTRRATAYGRNLVSSMIQEFSEYDPSIQIVSGLAYGIDFLSHQSAMKHNLRTIGVLGHGLQSIYPSMHQKSADEMVEKGGAIITEYIWDTPALPHQFIQRNRIIAGLCEACIIVESGIKGGSMRTAYMASGYNRDVFCFPGRVTDYYSKGCHALIESDTAGLIQNGADVFKKMGWRHQPQKPVQSQLFAESSDLGKKLILEISDNEIATAEILAKSIKCSIQETLAMLLDMEINGIIGRNPGGSYYLLT